MFNFLSSLLNSIFSTIFRKRRNIIFTMLLLKKENEIYRRNLALQNKKMQFKKDDKFTLAMINAFFKRAINHSTIVKPETPGRKPVTRDIKKLILEIKQENHLWGCHRIADELKKLGIILNPTTVNRIIQTFRKQGKIKPTGSWKRFLKKPLELPFRYGFYDN